MCDDIDECYSFGLNNCHMNAACFNFPSSFNCSCSEGFDLTQVVVKCLTDRNEDLNSRIFRQWHSLREHKRVH